VTDAAVQEVLTFVVDVSDPGDLATGISRVERRFEFGPIDGEEDNEGAHSRALKCASEAVAHGFTATNPRAVKRS
jgi:hypothetical protein